MNLDSFDPISLADIKAVQLMSRIDQKYLTSLRQLPELLQRIAGSYYVQRIGGEAEADYRTLYFDTADLAMYTQHHNRKLHRQKLRVRTYRSTLTTFFELKDKDNKGRTRKTRIPIPPQLFDNALSLPEVSDFVNSSAIFPAGLLLPQLENSFRRITLADKGLHERVTIDCGIRFRNRLTGLAHDLSPLVVIEVKHEVGAPPSPIRQSLRDLRIPPCRISKYCIGTLLTNPDAKANRFKPKLRYINQILGQADIAQPQSQSINLNP